MVSNPVLVEVTRGEQVESRHRGAVAVMDADGRIVLSIGDIGRPVFPRSAVKAFQALPLIESGTADRYGFGDAEIALAVSSHNGEPRHVETAARMLACAGCDVASLECGAHWPQYQPAANDLVRAGLRPSALHNNCSGKHAGFVCLACAQGDDPAGYANATHPTMRAVIGAVEAMTGTPTTVDLMGTDGCSIPTLAAPLAALAQGFARFATGVGLSEQRARAARRIMAAVAAEPFMLAGSGKFDSELTALFGARLFVKTGAEGVYTAAIPEAGLGIALKCDDGATRAAEVMMAAMIARFLPMDAEKALLFARFLRPQLRNWRGLHVGEIRPAGPLAT